MMIQNTFKDLWLGAVRRDCVGLADWWRNPFSPDDVYHEFTAELIRKYVHYYSESSGDEIYFPFRDYWFSIQENCPVYGMEDGQQVTIDAPVLKSIWIHPDRRERGYQAGILRELTELANRTFEPLAAFTGPFRLEVTGESIFGSMDYFVLRPYQKIRDDVVLEQQRNRLKKAGFVNHIYPHFRETDPEDHMLFIPEDYPVEFSSLYEYE